MHVEVLAGLQNMQLSEYFMRGKELLPRKICPIEKLQFLLGWGERLYVLYLSGLQTPK